MRVRVRVRACVRARVCVRVYLCVCVCVCVFMQISQHRDQTNQQDALAVHFNVEIREFDDHQLVHSLQAGSPDVLHWEGMLVSAAKHCSIRTFEEFGSHLLPPGVGRHSYAKVAFAAAEVLRDDQRKAIKRALDDSYSAALLLNYKCIYIYIYICMYVCIHIYIYREMVIFSLIFIVLC